MKRSIIISFLFATLMGIASTAPSTDTSSSSSKLGHIKDIENLRDLINPINSNNNNNKKGNKKPRKYKCIVVEDGDDDETIANKLSQNHLPQMDKNKFVFIEADDERREMGVTTEATTISVAPTPISSNSMRYQQQQQFQQVQQPQVPQQHQQFQQQQQQSSSFLQSRNDFEKITEEEAAVEYPPYQPQESQARYQERVVTLPPPSQSLPSSFHQQQSSHPRPQLKQIHLPKAHTFSGAASKNSNNNNNFAAAAAVSAQLQTTLPPEIANAPRDAQNRPLILAPEHCDQIKKYAGMYGVSDVKAWVHNNCSFAQTYLPTASCEEIDILVASCYRNQ